MSKHYGAPQYIAAIKGSRGIVTTIAQRVGCGWITARKAIDSMPTVKAAYDAECETVLDVAESVVGTNIYLSAKTQKENGETVDAADAKWYLSKKGKHRGYAERLELAIDERDLDAAIARELARVAAGGKAPDAGAAAPDTTAE